MILIDLILILLILACIVVEGFFSGSETAIISADRSWLHSRVLRGDRRAAVAERLLARAEELLGTTLAGTNIALVAATTLATTVIHRHLSGGVLRYENVITTVIMAPVILIFAEIIPKSICRHDANRITLFAAPILRTTQRVLGVVVKIVSWIAALLLRPFGGNAADRSPYVGREEVRLLARAGQEYGIVGDEESQMIHAVLEIDRRPALHAMVPMDQIARIDRHASLVDYFDLVAHTGFSRIVVYDGRPDNVVGTVAVMDALDAPEGAETIDGLVNTGAPRLDTTKSVGSLLRDLRQARSPLAFLKGEDGRIVGMVTLEDVLEEIIGEIEDERDAVDTPAPRR